MLILRLNLAVNLYGYGNNFSKSRTFDSYNKQIPIVHVCLCVFVRIFVFDSVRVCEMISVFASGRVYVFDSVFDSVRCCVCVFEGVYLCVFVRL